MIMKKIFSLLLVVAMLASLSMVASAATNNVMSTEVVETTEGITVTVYITNPANVAGFTASLAFPTTLTTDKSYTLAEDFAACSVTPSSKTASGTNQVRFQATFGTATDKFVTKTGKVAVISFPLTRTDATAEYASDDFAYASGLYAAKMTLGDNTEYKQTAAAAAAQFTAPVYSDERAPESPFSATAAGTTITCAGKVDATVDNYGVVFTAESTVEGARAQKYYGAMNGDTVKDYNGSTTFTFEGWDGTFEIILEGVHAGEKELDFFVNDTVIEDTNFILNIAE